MSRISFSARRAAAGLAAAGLGTAAVLGLGAAAPASAQGGYELNVSVTCDSYYRTATLTVQAAPLAYSDVADATVLRYRLYTSEGGGAWAATNWFHSTGSFSDQAVLTPAPGAFSVYVEAQALVGGRWQGVEGFADHAQQYQDAGRTDSGDFCQV